MQIKSQPSHYHWIRCIKCLDLIEIVKVPKFTTQNSARQSPQPAGQLAPGATSTKMQAFPGPLITHLQLEQIRSTPCLVQTVPTPEQVAASMFWGTMMATIRSAKSTMCVIFWEAIYQLGLIRMEGWWSMCPSDPFYRDKILANNVWFGTFAPFHVAVQHPNPVQTHQFCDYDLDTYLDHDNHKSPIVFAKSPARVNNKSTKKCLRLARVFYAN